MITIPTVLVLGAGASKPFGFPLGQDLLNEVVRDLHFKDPNGKVGELVKVGFDNPSIQSFRSALAYSAQPSIDAFLEHRPEFLEIGKAAIAQALMRYESQDSLFDPAREDANWYKYLFGKMCPGRIEDFAKNKLSVVTFNYDRSLEHFLFTALYNSFQHLENTCAEVLKSLQVVHVHGQLGYLPWQGVHRRQTPVKAYDGEVGLEAIKHATQLIRVVHENNDEDPEYKRARDLLCAAQRIVFLGFGYHEANVRRLRPQDWIGHIKKSNNEYQARRIQGTSYGLTGKEAEEKCRMFVERGRSALLLRPEQADVLSFLRSFVDFI